MAPKGPPYVWPFDDTWVLEASVPSPWVDQLADGMALAWAKAIAPAASPYHLPRPELVRVCQEVLARPAAAMLAADLALQEWIARHYRSRQRVWSKEHFSWRDIGSLMDGMTAQGARQHFARPLRDADEATQQLRDQVLADVRVQLRREAESRRTRPPRDVREGRSDVLARRMNRTLTRAVRGTVPNGWEPMPSDLFQALWEGRRYLVGLEWTAVAAARKLGLSWSQIASAIGLSRQATQKRYDPFSPNGGPGAPRNRRSAKQAAGRGRSTDDEVGGLVLAGRDGPDRGSDGVPGR
jgi:hypothetical protein